MSASTTPPAAADTAAVLEERAAQLARTEEAEEPSEQIGLMLFRLGDEWYAVRLASVREIYTDFTVTRLPRAPEYILGAISVRGEVLSVTDLSQLLQARGALGHAPGRCANGIIVQTSESVTALVVDEIGDIVEVPAEALEAPVTASGGSGAPVEASVFVEGRLVAVVDVARVLAPVGETG